MKEMKMKPSAIAAASSVVLFLSLTAPPVAGEDPSQAQMPGESPHGIERPSEGDQLGAGSVAGSEDAPMVKDQGGPESGYIQGMPVMRAGDLKGLKLGDAVGEKIGEVDAIVRDKATGALRAVVSVGGFLGIGAELVTIPLEDLKLEGEGLTAHQASTKEELKAQPAFNEVLYEKVPAGERVDLGQSLDVESGR